MDAADYAFRRLSGRPARRASRRVGHRSPPRAGRGGGVRWDRLGRVALVVVLGGILLLYIGPLRSYWSTLNQEHAARAQLAQLQSQNRRLHVRQAALADPATLEAEARKQGMVRAGELPYVVSNLPHGH
jgi:cell division protein FtsB